LIRCKKFHYFYAPFLIEKKDTEIEKGATEAVGDPLKDYESNAFLRASLLIKVKHRN
jgi:hypothetical protein